MLNKLSKLEDMISVSSISDTDKVEILSIIDELRLEFISAEISYRFKKLYDKLRIEILQYEKQEPFILKKINELL
ncbi:MAG: hypothetical protein K1X86_01820 [Ignavibacteria bacterium]|nr:hypothetical protein [Ignavibacteria bacterium]